MSKYLTEMSSAKDFALKIFHFLVASHYIFAIYYDWVYVLPEEIKLRNYSFGGKLVYLTVLNAVSDTTNLFTSLNFGFSENL